MSIHCTAVAISWQDFNFTPLPNCPESTFVIRILKPDIPLDFCAVDSLSRDDYALDKSFHSFLAQLTDICAKYRIFGII